MVQDEDVWATLAAWAMDMPEYYVTAGKRNVKLHQVTGLSMEHPAVRFGPYEANDAASRSVDVYATDNYRAQAILADWKSRKPLRRKA